LEAAVVFRSLALAVNLSVYGCLGALGAWSGKEADRNERLIYLLEVPCGSIRSFLHYLCSEGTKRCEILSASTIAMGFVDLRLAGPVADDEVNHLLHYRLTRDNVGTIEEAEKELLVRKLIEHYPTQGDNPYQKVRMALTAFGVSLA